jgi:FtsP/CotA-like multicopper oxidase with cupredoxin domain
MKTFPQGYLMPILLLAAWHPRAEAGYHVQCPGDLDGDAVIDVPDPNHPNAVCRHFTGGDGFVTMADGRVLYIFGFADVTGLPSSQVGIEGTLAANFPAPTLELNEGDELFLTLSNVGMVMRPDLFDPHSVHWHGFPNATPIFDGVPEASISTLPGSSLTYYYNVVDPGTYMYHCHVEATEHMQMGMLGNLYVHPKQDGTPKLYQGKVYTKFLANDGDGSTGYDVEYAIQLGSFDPDFHDADLGIQPLPMALMRDRYALLNGRGYPDTVNPAALPGPADNGGRPVQLTSSLITATRGQRILLRLSSLSVTRLYTVAVLGIPMKVVGFNARLLRGPSPDGGTTAGRDVFYDTSSVTLGGGETLDVMLDTTDVAPGTYFLYTANLNYLSNDREDFGGMMTEIHINAP